MANKRTAAQLQEAAEHATLLRRAMATAELSHQDVATALGVSKRTIVNWVSKTDPTMPSETLQANLRRILPGYADVGDPVELAIRNSDLAPFRQARLIADYQELLHQQRLEDQRPA